jgi:hypothetical protein
MPPPGAPRIARSPWGIAAPHSSPSPDACGTRPSPPCSNASGRRCSTAQSAGKAMPGKAAAIDTPPRRRASKRKCKPYPASFGRIIPREGLPASQGFPGIDPARVRNFHLLIAVLAVRCPQHHEPPRIAKRQPVQEHARDYAEDRRVGADPQRQCQNQSGAPSRTPRQQT